jgi:predicted nuclease of predicted toxin-antitoxin system
MLRLLSDENFDHRVLRVPLARQPGLDLVRVQDVGLMQTPDPDILTWCAVENRILVTHDRDTIAGFASDRVSRGEPMPGVFVVSRQMPIGRAIEELELRAVCGEMDEWRDLVSFIS